MTVGRLAGLVAGTAFALQASWSVRATDTPLGPPDLAAPGLPALSESFDLPPAFAQTAQAATDPAAAQNVLGRYCVSCHNDRTRTGGLTLQGASLDNLAEHRDAFEKVVRRLRSDSMPPPNVRRPSADERRTFIAMVEERLDEEAARAAEPGRTAAVHRLNRHEYQNAVRDLLGVEEDLAAMLPADGQNFGFDNIADGLTFSPLLLDRYLSVSRHVSRLAVGHRTGRPTMETYTVASDQGGQDDRLEELPYGTRGGMVIRHHFPLDAEYEFEIKFARNYNGQVVDLNEPHQLELLVDGAQVWTTTVEPMEGPRVLGGPEPDDDLRFRVPVSSGQRTVAVTFRRRSGAYTISDRLPFVRGDANLNALHGAPWVGEVIVRGPFEPATPASAARVGVLACASPESDEACAHEIVSRLARRAYRRPVTDADVDPLMTLFREERARTGVFEDGIEVAIQRILVGPSFLFRVESEPAGLQPGAVYPLNDLALASRLSFFLWSSIPDDDLLALAVAGRLRAPGVLDAQVARMLGDPRATALATNFAGQWLELRKLEEAAPDQQRFPQFDGHLRDSFRKETELFFTHILQGNRPLDELLTADYSFLNERLARHYDIPGVYGDRFRRVPVPAMRRGLLGHGSVLTVTSYGNRTSPVLRGQWVLSNLLGTPPPPPPPDVPDLPTEEGEGGRVLSMRERLAEHRRNPVCGACHSQMDPPGLALENFDAVGRWRTRWESGEPVDASAQLANGVSLDGVDGLRHVLVGQIDVFYHALTEKLLTYALGRPVGTSDAPAVRAILRDASRNGFRSQSLIAAVVKSVPFQMRRASDPSAGQQAAQP